ncbi:MAG: hypothetical protein HKO88_13365 [Xanthomonadales bacterium]|nr:hypothetical protein [Xanthomonadales bacterium]
MKLSTKIIVSIGIMVVALSFGNSAQANGFGVDGVWEVHITPDGAPGPVAMNIVHFDQDGTLTNIDATYGTGLGTWERMGGGSYTSEFTHLFDANGIPGRVVVQGSGQQGEDRDTATGEFLTTVYVGGILVSQFSGTIESFRK